LYFIRIYLVSRNSQGKKRSLEDNSDSSENQKPSYSYNDTSDAELMKWKKKCIDLEAKVKVFEEDYMRRLIFIKVFHEFSTICYCNLK
jgi:hypothetical protein